MMYWHGGWKEDARTGIAVVVATAVCIGVAYVLAVAWNDHVDPRAIRPFAGLVAYVGMPAAIIGYVLLWIWVSGVVERFLGGRHRR